MNARLLFFIFIYFSFFSKEIAAHDEFIQSLQALDQALIVLGKELKTEPICPQENVRVAQIDDLNYKVGSKIITLVVGNIVQQKGIDVLVNAAHKGVTTIGTAGIAASIRKVMQQEEHEFFAKEINKRYIMELDKQSNGKVGGAYIGSLKKESYLWNLGYRYLINAVGPNCKNGEDIALVANAYLHSLQESSKVGARSIILPRISAIVFGCPAEKINSIAITTIVDYLRKNQDSSLDHIYLIFFPGQEKDIKALEEYKKLLRQN